MLPAGEMELAGQDAGMWTVGVELANPSIMELALVMAVWVALVSLAAKTTEKEIESVVTCSRRLPPPSGEKVVSVGV
jgi:hypothetical protein